MTKVSSKAWAKFQDLNRTFDRDSNQEPHLVVCALTSRVCIVVKFSIVLLRQHSFVLHSRFVRLLSL
jgi:hypothetical protein